MSSPIIRTDMIKLPIVGSPRRMLICSLLESSNAFNDFSNPLNASGKTIDSLQCIIKFIAGMLSNIIVVVKRILLNDGVYVVAKSQQVIL